MLLINSNRSETIGKLTRTDSSKQDWVEMPENGVILLDKIQSFNKHCTTLFDNATGYTVYGIQFYCRDTLIIHFKYYDAVSRDEDFLNIVDAIRRHSVGN